MENENDFMGPPPEEAERWKNIREFEPTDGFMDDVKRYSEVTGRYPSISESAMADEHLVYGLLSDYRQKVLQFELDEARRLGTDQQWKLETELGALDRLLEHHAMKKIRIGDGILEEGLFPDKE